MRRFFVICLVLLFPLNVLALSLSVASLQTGENPHAALPAAPASDTTSEADRHLAEALDCKLTCDLDPDEPPSGADFHDTVNEGDEPQFTGTPLRTVAPFTPTRHLLSAFPPLKPPPLA